MVLPAVLVLLAAGAGWWWTARPIPPTEWQGYAEADFVKVGPTQQGLLVSLSVARGSKVAAGAPLFDQDDTNDVAARNQVARQLKQAEEQVANLQAGGKPTEIQQAEANLADAKAVRDKIEIDLRRNEAMLKISAVSQQLVDQQRADLRSATARVQGLEAALTQMRAPMGREGEIKAQQAMVESLRAAVVMAQWRIDQRHVTAPVAGVVADVLARPGETIPAGGPVASLLPPENIFVRFFVPETRLVEVHIGDKVALVCDRCPGDLAATISFIPAGRPNGHPAGDLQRGEPGQARLPGGGAAAAPGGRPDQSRPADRGAADGAATDRTERTAMSDYVIDVHDLRKSFGGVKVVDGLSLQVARGEICGFLGANGSGKTTTIRMLCGLLIADSGHGTCLGLDIIRQRRRADPSPGRLHDAEVQLLRRPHRVREPRSGGERLRDAAPARGGAGHHGPHGARGSPRPASPGGCPGGWKQRLRSPGMRPARTAPAACSTSRPPASTPRRGASSGT